MNFRRSILLFIPVFIALVNSAVVVNDGDVDQQGLYSKSDRVDILTNRNFERKLYGQKHAIVVQFYNSYCGHCRAFAPRFKAMAGEITPWKNIVSLAVLDCSVEENNEICRQFEVMAYPSLRYLHEFYVKGNGNVGDKILIAESAEKLKSQLIAKMQSEQSAGRLPAAPKFNIESYSTYSAALKDVPSDINYTFLVLENGNSTVGSELALDVNDYPHVRVKRVYDTSEVANTAKIQQFPGVVAVTSSLEPTTLTTKEPSKENLLRAMNTYLKSKNYAFPTRDKGSQEIISNEHSDDKPVTLNTDLVYYTDLEKTLKTSLHTEITRFKTLTGEPLQALLDYLDVLITSFPARGNLKEYLMDLYNTLRTRNSWSGSEVYELVKRLETNHAPVYTTNNLEYIRCKGSQPKFRGYTCGLWTLFHTLTVNAAQKPESSGGPKVLKAMHGYVKHFFGCTDCAQHFQAMAARNRIFDVKENDKAVLWLWIAHNEVNLRLAGDVTEDPEHPKIQFPTVGRCPECRLARGAWNLPAVFQYLQNVYGADNIQVMRRARSSATAASPFSNLDIGMLSLLYM
ncbi:quiescin sulfhydryl oxidase 1 isoform X2 [Anticarsia gemmatalis]|uniref:quiescin sulfhydryl oxidase 1 isoform X2 n=1 Tax=Anticarsia gemmatalis TaxID=129554 RepID=UPI003F772AF4